jgi:hypothetical protein
MPSVSPLLRDHDQPVGTDPCVRSPSYQIHKDDLLEVAKTEPTNGPAHTKENNQPQR